MNVCVCVSVCVGGVFVRVQQSVNYFSDLILYLFQQTWVSLAYFTKQHKTFEFQFHESSH